MKASFFFPSLPSLGSFLLRRFLTYTRSLALFFSGVGCIHESFSNTQGLELVLRETSAKSSHVTACRFV